MTKTANKAKQTAPQGAQNESVSGAEEAEALSRVRELLFGEATREHTDQLLEVQEQLDQKVESLRAAYETQFASIRAEMKRELDALQWKLNDLASDKLNRRDLSSLMTEVADRLATVG